MAAIVDIGVEPDDAPKPLRRALEHRLQQVRERCLLLLGFTGDAVTLRRAGEQLDSDEAEQRASASRCWTRRSPGTPAAPDDSVRGSSRDRCLAADVDDVSAAAAGTLSASVPADHTRWAPFRAMDPSLRHTHHAVVGRGRLAPDLSQWLTDESRLVSETAAWALHSLSPSLWAEHEKRITEEGLVAPDMMYWIESWKPGERPMFLTVEKVMVLRSVGVFSDVPEGPCRACRLPRGN